MSDRNEGWPQRTEEVLERIEKLLQKFGSLDRLEDLLEAEGVKLDTLIAAVQQLDLSLEPTYERPTGVSVTVN